MPRATGNEVTGALDERSDQGFLGSWVAECSGFGRQWVERKQRECRVRGCTESRHTLKQRNGQEPQGVWDLRGLGFCSVLGWEI